MASKLNCPDCSWPPTLLQLNQSPNITLKTHTHTHNNTHTTTHSHTNKQSHTARSQSGTSKQTQTWAPKAVLGIPGHTAIHAPVQYTSIQRESDAVDRIIRRMK